MYKENTRRLLNKIDNCEILETLGQSQLGYTFKVHHAEYGICAMKLLRGKITENKKFLKRVLENVELAKQIYHPCFAKLYTACSHPQPYVLREFIEGDNLEKKIHESPLVSIEATKYLMDTCLGVQAASNFGMQHKNLKPSNIIINSDNKVKVLDFFFPASAPYYFSPEHCSGETIDRRSDIYSIGVIFYQALTGHVPFSGSLKEIQKQHLSSLYPYIPDLPTPVKEIFDKTLAKSPEQRFQNFMELFFALKKAMKVFKAESEEVILKESTTFSIKAKETEKRKRVTTMLVMEKDKKKNKETSPTTKIMDDTGIEVINSLEDVKELKTEKQDQQESPENTPQPDSTLPPFLRAVLLLAVGKENVIRHEQTLTKLRFSFHRQYKEKIIEYLLHVLRQECWLLKDNDKEYLDIQVDLEEAKTLRYFNFFDDQIHNSMSELPILSTIHKTVITRMEEIQSEEEDKKDYSSSVRSQSVPMYSMIDTIMSIPKGELPLIVDDFDENSDGGFDEDSDEGFDEDSDEGFDEDSDEGFDEDSDEDNTDSRITGDEDSDFDEEVIPLQEEGYDVTSTNFIPLPENEENPNSQNEGKTLDIVVNFRNAYQTRAWLRLVRELALEQGKHFQLKTGKNKKLKNMRFVIDLTALQQYQKKRAGISSVREFFQGDYDISRLDHGGMATVLKLTAKHEYAIIFLRPENHWAREYFKDYLRSRKVDDGKEFVYAQIPKGSEVVIKVAFEGNEEALVYESRLLANLANESKISKYIIGMVQEGSFLASVDSKDDEKLGYYLMLEYASNGNIEQFSKNFPLNRLPASVVFHLLYCTVITLSYLKSKGIIHRDIKPQNILVNDNIIAKLSDFGLAVTVEEAEFQLNDERRRLLRLVDKEFLQISSEKEHSEARLQRYQEKTKHLEYPRDEYLFAKFSLQIIELQNRISELIKQELERAEGLKKRYRPMSAEEIALKGEFAGSLIYAAPEQFSPSKILTCQCDVYQLGAVTYTMFTAKPPVYGKNIRDVMSQILFSQKPQVSDVIKDSPVTDAMSDLIYKMMKNDPTKRTNIEEVREQLENILIKHFEELSSDYKYSEADYQNPKRQEQIEFAKNIHAVCVKYLRELYAKIEKNQTVIAKVEQQEKEPIKTVYLYIDEKVMKSIRLRCPHCTQKLKMPVHQVGKKIRCPHCQNCFVGERVDMDDD